MDGWPPSFPKKRRTYDEREDAARAPKRPREAERRLAAPPGPHAGGSGQRQPDYPASDRQVSVTQRDRDGGRDRPEPRPTGTNDARPSRDGQANTSISRSAPGRSGPVGPSASRSSARPGPPGSNRPPLPAGPRHSTGSSAPRPAAHPPTLPKAVVDAIVISDSSEDEAPLLNRRHTMPAKTHMEGNTIVIESSDDEHAPAQRSRSSPSANPEASRPGGADSVITDGGADVRLPAVDPAAASNSENGLAGGDDRGERGGSRIPRTVADAPPSSTSSPSPSPPPSPPRAGSHFTGPIRIGPPKGKRRTQAAACSAANRREPSPGPSRPRPKEVIATEPTPAHPSEAQPIGAGSSVLPLTASSRGDSLAQEVAPMPAPAPTTANAVSISNDGQEVSGVTVTDDEDMDDSDNSSLPQDNPVPRPSKPKAANKPLSYYMQFYTAPARSVDAKGAARWTFVCKLCDTIRTVARGELETEFVLAPKTHHLFSNFTGHIRTFHFDYDPAQLRAVNAAQRAEEWKSSTRKFTIKPGGEWLLPARANRWGRQQHADTASSGSTAPAPQEQDPHPPPAAVDDNAEASAASRVSITRVQPEFSEPLVDPALMDIGDGDDWSMDPPVVARRVSAASGAQSRTPTPPPPTPPSSTDDDPLLSAAVPTEPSGNAPSSSSLPRNPRPSHPRILNPFTIPLASRSPKLSAPSSSRAQPGPSTSARKANPFSSAKHASSRSPAKSKQFGAIERYLSPVKKARPGPPPSAEASTNASTLPTTQAPPSASGARPPEEPRVAGVPHRHEDDLATDVFGPVRVNDHGVSPPVVARSHGPPAERSSATRFNTQSEQPTTEPGPAQPMAPRPLSPATPDADPLLEDEMDTRVTPEPAPPAPPESTGISLPKMIASALTSMWRRQVAESVAAGPAAPARRASGQQSTTHTDSDREDDATMQDDFDRAPEVPPTPPARSPEPLIADTIASAASAIGSDHDPALFVPALRAVPSVSIAGHVSSREEAQSQPSSSSTFPSNDADTESDDDVPISTLKQRRDERRAAGSRDPALDLPLASPAVPDEAHEPVASQSAEETDAVAVQTEQRAQLVRAARALRWPAEEVDTIMYDVIDNLHEHNRRDPSMRRVFENVMVSNTLHDEPDAPPITVANTVNADPCPPWEFHYTNKLFYGQNVRRGDPAKLKGCNCVGGCRPDSKTCACLKRQYRYLRLNNDKSFRGFIYNEDGTLKILDFPIFECNEACGCDENCMNRVVQRGRQYPVEIKNTADKGWGVFAKSDIPTHSFVGVYAGELITDRESHAREALYTLVGRSYLFAVEMWYLKKRFRRKYRKDFRSGSVTSSDEERTQPDDDEQSSVFVVDAFHVGNFTRFLNHSCQPNCALVPVHINEPHLYKPFLCFFTEKAVKAGEELTFSYCGTIGEKELQDLRDDNNQQNGRLQIQCRCGAEKCVGRLFTSSAGGDGDAV